MSIQSPLSHYIHFTPIRKAKNKDEVYVYPLSGRIMSEKEYEELAQIKSNRTSNNKKRFSSEIGKGEGKLFSNWNDEKIQAEIDKVEKEIEKNEEEQQSEKEKAEIDKYTKLSLKWKKIAQDAIYKLIECYPQDEHYNPNTIKNVIHSLNLDKDLLGYDSENDCFTDD